MNIRLVQTAVLISRQSLDEADTLLFFPLKSVRMPPLKCNDAALKVLGCRPKSVMAMPLKWNPFDTATLQFFRFFT